MIGWLLKPRLVRRAHLGTLFVPIEVTQYWFDKLTDGVLCGGVRFKPTDTGAYRLILSPIPQQTTTRVDLLNDEFVSGVVDASLELLVAVENADDVLVTDNIIEKAQKLRRIYQQRIG